METLVSASGSRCIRYGRSCSLRTKNRLGRPSASAYAGLEQRAGRELMRMQHHEATGLLENGYVIMRADAMRVELAHGVDRFQRAEHRKPAVV